MLSLLAAALLATPVASPPTTAAAATRAIPNDTRVHLGVTLKATHLDELEALKIAQQDPRSPAFRRWLTPAEFGERFGQPRGTVREVSAWLESAGLTVEVLPNQLFLNAWGTAAQVERLLRVQLAPVDGAPASVHSLEGHPVFPPSIAPLVVHVAGLDTRVRTRHHLSIPPSPNTVGPQDARRFYGVAPLHALGAVGQGQTMVVLSTATPPSDSPSPVTIGFYLRSVSDARAPYVRHEMPNPQQDYDTQQGAAGEFELDVEMQSIGAPGADKLVLQVAPASEVFTSGVQDIVNSLPNATAVSISLGMCEPNEKQLTQQTGMDEAAAMRQGVTQGVMQGQSWFAASGDTGANDCRNGSGPAVDFPSSMPEIVGMGGTSIPGPAWNGNGALAGWQTEVVWNDGAQGGAAGGGTSILFGAPQYQAALGIDGGRQVPDLSLIAGLPGVAMSSAVPPGQLEPAEGTSVASPLAAGFFGAVASRLGCRLGDLHAVLYALGAAQATDAGPAVFHDVTSGNLTVSGIAGPSAVAGYDSASGWGSLDVAALAAALPPCPAPADGGVVDAGTSVDAGAPYDACAFIGCDAGSCLSLADGPSSCLPRCDPAQASSCPAGSVCNKSSVYASGALGGCVPGCASNADCVDQPGTVCSLCAHVCVATGSSGARISDPCTTDAQCPTGATCNTSRMLPNGYCTQACTLNAPSGDACSCPSGTVCGTVGLFQPDHLCLLSCLEVGMGCIRSDYICQPQNRGTPACLPKCEILSFGSQTFDTCRALGTNKACDTATGICGGMPPPFDAGVPDAGPPPDYEVPALTNGLGARYPACGCSTAEAMPLLTLALLGFVARRRR